MFIGYYELEEKEYFNIYYDWNAFYNDTFSPLCKNIKVLEFKLHGRNYKDRKASLYDLAVDYSNNFMGLCWSYGELAEITDYFYRNGKRYGLLKEFRENAIC